MTYQINFNKPVIELKCNKLQSGLAGQRSNSSQAKMQYKINCDQAYYIYKIYLYQAEMKYTEQK